VVQDYSFAINPAVSLSSGPLPNGTIGIDYDTTIIAAGGTGDKQLAVSIISGVIDGLNIPATGTNTLELTGQPTATGTVTFTVTGTDTLGASSFQQ